MIINFKKTQLLDKFKIGSKLFIIPRTIHRLDGTKSLVFFQRMYYKPILKFESMNSSYNFSNFLPQAKELEKFWMTAEEYSFYTLKIHNFKNIVLTVNVDMTYINTRLREVLVPVGFDRLCGNIEADTLQIGEQIDAVNIFIFFKEHNIPISVDFVSKFSKDMV